MKNTKSQLSQWLSTEGFVKKAKSASPDTKKPKTASPKPKATKPAPKKTSRPPARKGRSSGAKSSSGKSGGRRFSDYNPLKGRPTAAKRDKHHPINSLSPQNVGDIRVVPLGGMEQVGCNMMFLEWGNDIVIIDTGFLFPSPEHLGIDILLPDISYLVKKKKNIRGIIYTHGHLDHIGGVPYLVPQLGYPPMYATRLTKELILANSSEHGITDKLKLSEINPKSKIRLGKFEFEFFHINHSIPDGVGIVAKTPYGQIVHTSDFKIDHNPSDDQPADLSRIAEIGHQGVALALVDSTNALKSGHTLSESVIEAQLAKVIKQTEGRLIITTFASSVGRIAKVVEAAEQAGRTVFLSGRSMERNIAIARKLNYLKCKDKTIQSIKRSNKADTLPPSKVLILSTGSQGEELAALTRMAAGTHRSVKLKPTDTIVFSSSPIPGNETAIVSVLNNLSEIGVNMIDKNDLDIYVSGHGHAEEVKLMTTLLNPKYFAPIHGEMYMRYGHRDLVVNDLNFNPDNTFVMKNGQGVVLNAKGARLMKDKEAIPAGITMVEMGEKVGEHTLADRTLMADGGAIFITVKHHNGSVKTVEIRSPGFRLMNMDHEIFKLVKAEVKKVFERNFDPARPDKALEETIKQAVTKFFWQKFKKEPLVEVVV